MRHYKKLSMLIALIAVILLGACGSSEEETTESVAFNGNLQKIEYDDLIDKLDNGESFFLLTLETTDEAFIDSGLEKAFDQALGEHGIEAYYYGIETMDENEEDREEHAERFRTLSDYSRFEEFDSEDGEPWYPLTSGLAYSDNGEVVVEEIAYSGDPTIEWEDIKQFQSEQEPDFELVNEMVEIRIEELQNMGVIE